MVQSSSISITPATHADRHIHGAEDPLVGDVRIDPITPAAHHASHEQGGTDVVDAYGISDALVHSNDTPRTSSSVTYVKAKEIVVATPNTHIFRVIFELNRRGVGTCYGRIYINGVGVGTERTRTAGAEDYLSYSEDLSIDNGDLLQVYIKKTGGGDTVGAKNFRIGGIALPPQTYTNQDP